MSNRNTRDMTRYMYTDFICICSDTSSMQEERESFTPVVVESSSVESLSSQTDESVITGENTSMMVNTASSLTSNSDLQGTSEAADQTIHTTQVPCENFSTSPHVFQFFGWQVKGCRSSSVLS